MRTRNGGSFSNAVIIRLLRILLENGELKKSNLCNKAGLNYKVCTRYVNHLAHLQWIETKSGGENRITITIPQQGVEILRRLESANGADGGSTIGNFSSQYDDDPIIESALTSTSNRSKNAPKMIKKPMDNSHQSQSFRYPNRSSADARMKRIVIVDDDENALSTYGSFLSGDKNLDVTTFSDSRKAFEYLTRSSNPDLIILDIRMPGISGLRLFQGIRAMNPAANMIFLTALDAAPELLDTVFDRDRGNGKILRKPVGRAAFLAAVQKALDTS